MTLAPGLQVHRDRGRHRRGPRQGKVSVLAIPRVLASAERATVAAAAGALAAGATRVGTQVELDHLAPQPGVG